MSANSARGKGRLTETSKLEYLLWAVNAGGFWAWAGMRALPIGGGAGFVTFLCFGRAAGWIVGVSFGMAATLVFAIWTIINGDDLLLPDSSLTLGRDGLRVDVTVEIWHSGISINESPINAWIVEQVIRRGGDRVDMLVSSKDVRTTLTIRTKKEALIAHLERLATLRGRLE